tara:strand:+ start:109 stop:558 length:450 start_codon:yes stop_codon:yes gene_type:complete
MSINFRTKNLFNLLNIPLLIYLTTLEINIFNKRLLANTKPQASQQDIFLYKQMGASYLCKALNDKIDFDFNKALTVSTYTFAEVIFSKHGNLIQEAGAEKLTTPKVLYIGEIEILNSAIKICPKQIPSDVKKSFEKALKNLKKQKNKKN